MLLGRCTSENKNAHPLAEVYSVGFTSAQQGHATSSVPRHALLYPLFGCIAYIRFISSLYFVCTVSVCLTSSPRSNVNLLFYCGLRRLFQHIPGLLEFLVLVKWPIVYFLAKLSRSSVSWHPPCCGKRITTTFTPHIFHTSRECKPPTSLVFLIEPEDATAMTVLSGQN